MKIQSHMVDGKGAHVFLVELSAHELEILTLLPAEEVENVAVGAEVEIDPESPLARRHLSVQKTAAIVLLRAIGDSDPSLSADADALVGKLGAARAELAKP